MAPTPFVCFSYWFLGSVYTKLLRHLNLNIDTFPSTSRSLKISLESKRDTFSQYFFNSNARDVFLGNKIMNFILFFSISLLTKNPTFGSLRYEWKYIMGNLYIVIIRVP